MAAWLKQHGPSWVATCAHSCVVRLHMLTCVVRVQGTQVAEGQGLIPVDSIFGANVRSFPLMLSGEVCLVSLH
jgi:hypothetical protein